MTPGAKGQFDVVADDRLIFSKADCGGRFPDAAELLGSLRG